MTIASQVVALVPAAGRGDRFGAGVPKQLIPVGGRPLLAWTVERLLGCGVAAVVVALPGDFLEEVPSQIGADRRLHWVAGGDSRQESVRQCLRRARELPGDLLLVHDGARPATAIEDIRATLAAAAGADGAILGRPVDDTLKRLSGEWLGETVPRGGLFRAETPQVFRRDVLESAYLEATLHGWEATDEAGLVEAMGGVRLRAVGARFPNPKLTHPSDLALIELLLRRAG